MKELRILAYVSLVYGGFLVMAYLALFYSAVWRHEFLPVFPDNPRVALLVNGSMVPVNGTELPFNATVPPGEFERSRMVRDPFSLIFAPQSLGILLTGVLFLINGYFLLGHLRHKENKETKKFVISSLLSEEERAVYDELVKEGGQSTQKQLSLSTGFSPVKTYRLLKRLEGKKLIQTYPFGMTKKIVLNEA